MTQNTIEKKIVPFAQDRGFFLHPYFKAPENDGDKNTVWMPQQTLINPFPRPKNQLATEKIPDERRKRGQFHPDREVDLAETFLGSLIKKTIHFNFGTPKDFADGNPQPAGNRVQSPKGVVANSSFFKCRQRPWVQPAPGTLAKFGSRDSFFPSEHSHGLVNVRNCS